jgi:hypothetical protein
MMTHNENSSSNLRYLSLGPNLPALPRQCRRYFHLEKEIPCSPNEREEKVDIIAVRETHAVSEENLRRRGIMPCPAMYVLR